MSRTILIRGARQLLTIRGDSPGLGIIADGSLLIRDGFIAEVGPTRRVENLAAARDAEEIDATGRVVLPGFVDADARMGDPRPNERSTRLAARARAIATIMSRHGTTTMGVRAAEPRIVRALERVDEGPWNIVPIFTGPASGLRKCRRRNFTGFLDTLPAAGLATEGRTLSMQGVIALAVIDQRYSIETALRAATVEAGVVLGFGLRAGSLEPGRQADVLILNCSDYRDLARQIGVNHVHLTMKLGHVVYREGIAGIWPKP